MSDTIDQEPIPSVEQAPEQENNTPKQPAELNSVVRGIFIFFLVTSAINCLTKLLTNLGLGNTTLGLIMFVMEVANCVFLYMMLQRKGWAVLAFFGMLLLQIPLNLALGNPDMSSVYFSTFLRITVFSILLLIPKNGVTGWQVLFGQSSDSSGNQIIDTKDSSEQSEEEIESDKTETIGASISEPSHDAHIPQEDQPIQDSSQPDTEQVDKVVNCALPVTDNTSQEKRSPRQNRELLQSDSAKERSNEVSKGIKIGIAAFSVLIVALGVFALIVAVKSYPDYISSFGDKWKYTLNRPNEKLAKRMLDELRESQYQGQFFFEKEDGYIVEADNFYKKAGSIMNYLQGAKTYLVRDTVKNESEIDPSALYTARWSNGYKWASVNQGGGTGSYDFVKMIEKDPDLVYIRLEPVELKSYLSTEEDVFQRVSTIPLRDIELIKSLVDHYVIVENYNRAVDVAEFYLSYNKKNPELLGLTSFVCYKNRDYDKAEEYAERALKVDSKAVRPIEVKSYIASDSLEWEEAMKLSKKAIDYGSENADMYYIYSKSVFKQGETKLANEYYNKAFKINQFSPYAEKFKECGGCPVEIESITMGNVRYDRSIITDYGEKIYSSKTQFLSPKIKYNLLREEECHIYVKLYCKGKLKTGDDSSSGYTYDSFLYPWHLGECEQVISGWGNSSSGWWPAGNYRIEVWYVGEKIAEERFTVY